MDLFKALLARPNPWPVLVGDILRTKFPEMELPSLKVPFAKPQATDRPLSLQAALPTELHAGGTRFFGVGGEKSPGKVIYVIDRSETMTDSIDFLKYELKRSIGELEDDQEFHVIFYSSGPTIEMPTQRLVNATERNKQLAFEFTDSIVAQGQTEPSKALERAFACQPEVIYILTDSEFDRGVVNLVKRLNAGGKVTVHTIGFLYEDGAGILKQIAKDNGGKFKHVTATGLADLAR